LRKFIPDVKIETDIGTELTYVLNESYVSVFQKMFEELEEGSQELGISSYGVSLTTMEEVFLKIGTNAHVLQRMSSIDSASMEYSPSDPENVRRYRENTAFNYLTGTSLYISQCIAMFKKKFHYTRRNYKSMLFNVSNFNGIYF
jgi:ATP-binding cassette subfamily A (ABC1) protein 3